MDGVNGVDIVCLFLFALLCIAIGRFWGASERRELEDDQARMRAARGCCSIDCRGGRRARRDAPLPPAPPRLRLHHERGWDAHRRVLGVLLPRRPLRSGGVPATTEDGLMPWKTRECERCDGTGEISEECPDCDGTGEIGDTDAAPARPCAACAKDLGDACYPLRCTGCDTWACSRDCLEKHRARCAGRRVTTDTTQQGG